MIPSGAGALGMDELGFIGIVDTRYHMKFIFRHDDSVLDLFFKSLNLPASAVWGLDNVQVILDWSAVQIYVPMFVR